MPIAAAPTKPTIQIRPLSQMQPKQQPQQPQKQPFIAILPPVSSLLASASSNLPNTSQQAPTTLQPPIVQPQVSYTCSFCNTKQTSQVELVSKESYLFKFY